MAKLYSAEDTGVLDGAAQDLALPDETVRVAWKTFAPPGSGTFLTTDTMGLGFRRTGQRPIGAIISTSADLSAASLAIGNSGSSAKYKAAATLPNASTVFVPFKSTALDDGPLTAREELIGTISGATIPAGTLVIGIVYGER